MTPFASSSADRWFWISRIEADVDAVRAGAGAGQRRLDHHRAAELFGRRSAMSSACRRWTKLPASSVRTSTYSVWLARSMAGVLVMPTSGIRSSDSVASMVVAPPTRKLFCQYCHAGTGVGVEGVHAVMLGRDEDHVVGAAADRRGCATYSGCAYICPSTGQEKRLPKVAPLTEAGVSAYSWRFWPVRRLSL